jgi:hypothetical protein
MTDSRAEIDSPQGTGNGEPRQDRAESERLQGSQQEPMLTRSYDAVARMGKEASDELKKPTAAAAIIGAAVAGAALTVGIGETAIALAAAYVTYRAVKQKRDGSAPHS